jgi:hypothetical protein
MKARRSSPRVPVADLEAPAQNADQRRRREQLEKLALLVGPRQIDHPGNVQQVRVLFGSGLQQEADLAVADIARFPDPQDRPWHAQRVDFAAYHGQQPSLLP